MNRVDHIALRVRLRSNRRSLDVDVRGFEARWTVDDRGRWACRGRGGTQGGAARTQNNGRRRPCGNPWRGRKWTYRTRKSFGGRQCAWPGRWQWWISGKADPPLRRGDRLGLHPGQRAKSHTTKPGHAPSPLHAAVPPICIVSRPQGSSGQLDRGTRKVAATVIPPTAFLSGPGRPQIEPPSTMKLFAVHMAESSDARNSIMRAT